jgi:curli biogenesis system outer membrane secretion channel CsgG
MSKFLFIVVIGASLLQGCASPRTSVSMLMPARYSEPTAYKRVAVLPFAGSDGREMSQKVEAALVGIRPQDAPWFDVYERDRLKAALKELRLGSSGLVDSTTAAKVGRFIGVQGVYMGSVNTLNVDTSRFRETRNYCAEQGKKKCIRWRETTVRCRRKHAVFEFTPKLVDVETSRVVYSHLISKNMETSACDDSSYSITSNTELINILKKRALHEFSQDIAPYLIHREIAIKTDTDGLNQKTREYYTAGVEFAKEGRLDRGCELWGNALHAGANTMALYYNLGVCEESKGNFDEADEWFRKADSVLMKPDKEINKALTRMQKKRQARNKLLKQLN